ncbi:hypothetical protein BBP40_005362 [Aspergillus hancockii]|nr:hypothetical protein BBP40_005362 [Aspergillus hancockii]
MVSDGWSRIPIFSVLKGGEFSVSMDDVADYTAEMHKLDMPHSERIRARVDATGVQKIMESGVVANGESFDLDVVIFSMGFKLDEMVSPSRRAKVSVIDRGGQSVDRKRSQNPATLHGVISNGFPNMFFFNGSQAGVSPNLTSALDTLAHHVAFIITKCTKRAGPQHSKVIIEPTQEAKESWAMLIRAGALAQSSVAGCTPSNYNAEGGRDNVFVEEKMKAAAVGPWPLGLNDFMGVLQEWWDTGDLLGLYIASA